MFRTTSNLAVQIAFAAAPSAARSVGPQTTHYYLLSANSDGPPSALGLDLKVLTTVHTQVFNIGEPPVYGRGVEPAASVPARALDKLLSLAAKLHAES